MILIKRVGVFLNLVHYRFKQFLTANFYSKGIDITPEQFLLLDTLWDEGKMSQQKLANIMGKDKNSITKLVDQLEKKELVFRENDKLDRRSNLITLTEKGLSLKDEVTSIAVTAVNKIVEGISQSDLDSFVKVLKLMAHNINTYQINQANAEK